MNVIEAKFNIDIDNEQQLTAFNSFIKELKGSNGQDNSSAVITAPVKDIKAPAATTQAATTTAATTTAATTAPANGSTGSKKLDAIRKLIGEKAPDHRVAIKAKLTEYGTETATDLTVDKYDEFHAYLESL